MNGKTINDRPENSVAMMETLETRELYSVTPTAGSIVGPEYRPASIALNQPAQPTANIIAILIGL